MALRNTLAEIVEMVRDEARLSSNPSRGTDHLNNIKQLIKRHYYQLAEEHDFPFLQLKRDDTAGARKVLQAGSRLYNFPTNLNVLKITGAWVKWAGTWRKLDYGITYDRYSEFDPAQDQRTDPVTNWAFRDGTQFEAWPLPATDGTADGDNEIAFEGQKAVEQLTGDTSRLDMDGILVSLFVAAEILAGNSQKAAAEIKQSAATRRLMTIVGNTADQTRVAMGLGVIGGGRGGPRHPTYIRPS